MPLIGSGKAITALNKEIERVAPKDTKVLITGPTGSGKELVARAIHQKSKRASKPLIVVNCAALSESLLESELFGFKKGAFTGAYRDTEGKISAAHQGTLFLDEVGDMTLHMQGMMLRFLQFGEIQTLGSCSTKTVDVRVITATNADLAQMIKEKTFRSDLYYRLCSSRIQVPALEKHTEDIPELVHYFIRRFQNGNAHPIEISPDVIKIMQCYAWPGNVRELEGVIENLIDPTCTRVTLADLPPELREVYLSSSDLDLGSVTAVTTVTPEEHTHNQSISPQGLIKRMVDGGESFTAVVHPLFRDRKITVNDVRTIIEHGLVTTRGSYKGVANLYNIIPISKRKESIAYNQDYKKFLKFLRKHDCKLSYKQYRP